MIGKEKKELIEKLSKQVMEDYMRECEKNDFIGSNAGDILESEFPEFMA